jgi:20S proteasome subunit beta 2
MGSGSLAAMAVFESYWQPNLSRQKAIDLVTEAICAGIFNDLGSGSNVDVCVIEKGKTEMLRNYFKPNEKVPKELNYKWKKGTTRWTKEEIRKLVEVTKEEVIAVGEGLVQAPGIGGMDVDKD